MGVGKRLKELDERIKIVCAHPLKALHTGLEEYERSHSSFLYDPNAIDHTIMIESEAAFAMTRRIVREEGIFVGMSSGLLCSPRLRLLKLDSGVIVIYSLIEAKIPQYQAVRSRLSTPITA